MVPSVGSADGRGRPSSRSKLSNRFDLEVGGELRVSSSFDEGGRPKAGLLIGLASESG